MAYYRGLLPPRSKPLGTLHHDHHHESHHLTMTTIIIIVVAIINVVGGVHHRHNSQQQPPSQNGKTFQCYFCATSYFSKEKNWFALFPTEIYKCE